MADITNENFTRREISQEDLPLDFWHNVTETTDVIFEIDKKCLSDVEEWLGIENVHKKHDKYVAEAKLPFDNGLVSKIMSFGNGIKVIQPQELKDEIIKNTKSIIDTYNKKSER